MTICAITKDNNNGFRLWWDWFTSTMRKPLKCLNFWAYFVVGVIMCGGAGVWSLLFTENKPSYLMALCSFYLAIAGASCMDFVFRDDEKKFLKGFSFLCSAILAIFTLIAVLKEYIWIAIIATVISLILWWLANAENPTLADIAKPSAPIGGDIDNEIQGSTGGMLV